jgi:hypothetical protein
MNPKMVRSGPDLNLALFAARGRAVATLAKFRNACAALRFGDGPAGRPYLTSGRYIRSAVIGTGAELTQTRGWAERCEPNLGLARGQLALPRPARFRGSRRKTFGKSHSSLLKTFAMNCGRFGMASPSSEYW